jgi:hypothetical protein
VLPVGLVIPELVISLCMNSYPLDRNLGLFPTVVFTATIGCALYLSKSKTEGKRPQGYGHSIYLERNASLRRIDFPRHRLAFANGLAREARQPWPTSRAQPESSSRGAQCLLVLAEEEVVGRVGHELSLTHSAGGGRNSSVAGV